MNINLKRLDKWIEHMKSVPTQKLDMNDWIVDRGASPGCTVINLKHINLNDCGTTLCAAGHLINMACKDQDFKVNDKELIQDEAYNYLEVSWPSKEIIMLAEIFYWDFLEEPSKENVIRRLEELRAFVVGRMKQ